MQHSSSCQSGTQCRVYLGQRARPCQPGNEIVVVGIEKVLMGLGNFVLDVEAKQTQIFVSGDEIKKIYVTWHENPSPNKKVRH